MTRPVFRFAPSPNGDLHLGHAYSALLNRDLALGEGGPLLLRIEDIDRARSRPEFEAGILRDLEWLDLDWPRPVRRQSEHFADYADALDVLHRLGVIYPAFMTRGEARAAVAAHEASGRPWPRDPDGAPHYPGHDRDLSEAERQRRVDRGEPHAFRIAMDKAFEAAGGALSFLELGEGPDGETGALSLDPRAWGDVVVARLDTPTSYHLSVTVDDAIQGVTHVVRGQDLFHATSIHRMLQTLLGLPRPVYRHHRLILDQDGRKLSKSHGSTGLRALRATGATPMDVRRMVGL